MSSRSGTRPRLKAHAVRLSACLIAAVLSVQSLEAGQDAQPRVPPTPATELVALTVPPDYDGPSPPRPPEVITRDASGRATIRAVRLTAPLRVDGRLDEAVYTRVPPISDFIQQEPVEGAPASEKTEVWLTFDRNHVYVSVRCWESQPERLVRKEMRRDSRIIFMEGHDAVGFMFDTFYDRRSGFLFNVNAIGGRTDGQFPNERQYNGDWNPIWDVRTGRFEDGWTVEAAIPFKSLRYQPGEAQTWGFNLRRTNGWRNELSYITRVPAGRATAGTQMASVAATVVGLEVPPGSRNLEIKPFAVSTLSTDRSEAPATSTELGADMGLDLKYGLTQNLTADFTYNTDFAQVEADEQQVNLTRFSLFFPEKREFFLENQGLFAFGGAGTFGGGGGTPVLFYSRRIGLSQGREIPVDVGGRLTGRVGNLSVGLLNIQTGNEAVSGAEATNFSVVRVKQDILRRSSIGALFTGRSVSTHGDGSNEAYGVDGRFAFYDNLNINTYWARTHTPDRRVDEVSYRTQFDYRGDRYGVQLERLVVGTGFNPEVGFLRRDDFERSFGSVRFSPRMPSIAAVRKLSWEGRLDYITDRAGRLETREAQGQFGIEFENNDRFTISYTRNYEFLEAPFPIASEVTIPVGGYGFEAVRASFTLGLQRTHSGTVSVGHGSFFGGHKTTVGISRGRVTISPQFSIEPSFSFNRVTLPEGRFTTQLVTTRTTYTITPRMFVSALVQYQSDRQVAAANVRFRWEYQPGSELFVVFNEQRDTLDRGFPALANRAFIVKINRLVRF